jgi:hypothetical protein
MPGNGNGGDPALKALLAAEENGVPIEVFSEAPENRVGRWEQLIRHKCRNKCANCGSVDRLRVRMVVPKEAGGQLEPFNGILLCRACEMAMDSVGRTTKERARRPINFWMSRRLHNRLKNGVRTRNGFTSMSSLVRYLVGSYVTDEGRFDDLENYQEEGADVKINVWVEADSYLEFKDLLANRGMTVTDAVKALVRMYEAEAEPLVLKKD